MNITINPVCKCGYSLAAEQADENLIIEPCARCIEEEQDKVVADYEYELNARDMEVTKLYDKLRALCSNGHSGSIKMGLQQAYALLTQCSGLDEAKQELDIKILTMECTDDNS